ncbi:unknown protein [Seminavis robusta]|uniref:Uncharacterized protein n=1 Tax=Seminavis robusta TaxID=568900 RepID=A0A9N8D9J0_9STRA|nr:unknown protein [Seminavis robusta]|eukprot:Sro24_g016440.1 n/a (499) ;mRNA; f:95898-97394
MMNPSNRILFVLLILECLVAACCFTPLLPAAFTLPPSRIQRRPCGRPTITRHRASYPVSDNDGGNNNKVSVLVERRVENCSFTPSAAVDTWLEQHWKKGGGLPILIWIGNNKNNSSSDHDDDDQSRKRTILPVGMEETYEWSSQDENSTESAQISYTVSNSGPFFADLVPNSHRGTVQFFTQEEEVEQSTTLLMKWQVEFETTRFRDIYQAVTDFTIHVAARTVAEALAPGRVLRVESTLQVPASSIDDHKHSAARHALREWLEFFWARGGGLPLPPPIPFGPVLEEGGGTATASILRVPPLLVDTVLSIRDNNNGGALEAIYQIKNPGWTTIPFLIHTHLGRVRFVALSNDYADNNDGDDDGKSSASASLVTIIWEIQVRPFPLVAPPVEKLLEMTATTIVRNLAVHMVEPDAQVTLQPPRGKSIDLGGGTVKVDRLGSIPKASWLGGVLDAHVKDQSSVVDQTLALFQPWTWGCAKNAGSEQDAVQVQWTSGEMEE